MLWSASVDLTLVIDYDDIEADTKEEAEQIAIDRAREDIDYNNADESHVMACVWEEGEDEQR